MALPSGYTHLEYIESTGTQYIILSSIVQSAYQHIRIDAAPMSNNYSSGGLFGTTDDSGISFAFAGMSSTPVGAMTTIGPSTKSSYLSGAAVGQRVVLEKKQDPNNTGAFVILADGTGFTYGSVTASEDLTGSLHPYLFALNNDGSVSRLGKWRFYELIVYNSDETEAVHLVPARRSSDGECGVYDTVNDSFLGNSGSGSFDTVTIPPPSSIIVSDGVTVGSGVSIGWGSSSSGDVIGYELERSENGGAFSQIYYGTGLFYTDTASPGWETVQYRVRAISDFGSSSWVESPVRDVVNPFTPTSPNYSSEYRSYLAALKKPFQKLVKLEFLQPDDSVAFALGGRGQRMPIGGRDTRTFLQSGSVSVNLANGSRRKASITLGNRDGAFDFAVNKLWFGQRVRISMGMRLPDGEDFYFPMGVFYIENPSVLFSPGEKTATLSLTDKWAYLDGSLFGTLEAAYSVNAGTNIFSAINSFLGMSKYTYQAATDTSDRIDPQPGVFTTYFNGKTYEASHSDGSITTDIAMTSTPYVITENRGSTMAAVILKLNEMLAGWVGYDAAGMLRLEPSQDDIDDADKPVLFAFTPENSVLLSVTENPQVSSVYNDVTVAGEGLTDATVWARAVNEDPDSDTNIHLVGRKVFTEEKADYWNTDQCAALARFYLKRKSVLQKAVSIECGQMFHLIENRLISVKRTDKPGSPVEKHLIQGFSIPIAETGSMSISCVSVNDIPDFTVTTSISS